MARVHCVTFKKDSWFKDTYNSLDVVTKVLELKCSILCPITHVLVYHLKFSYFFLRSTTNLETIQ